jgi:aminoglycoside phosphotransferase (APT) family kinase protein
MYAPPLLVLRSLRQELSPLLAQDRADASLGQSVASAIHLLEVREAGGARQLRLRLGRLGSLLARLAGDAPESAKAPLHALLTATSESSRLDAREALEGAWERILRDFEALMGLLLDTPALPSTLRTELSLNLGEWEIEDRCSLTAAQSADHDATVDTSITRERFQRYLQDRYDDPQLRVPAFQQLAGGFGKETYLVEVEGKALSGALVVRRDPLVVTVGNDCHWVRLEYPVVRAAFERGFPAPETIWVDTNHRLLPGGDFMVMRRSPGRTGGNVFGSEQAISEELVRVLAVAMARLHTLPPCTELGELTESIHPGAWNLSLKESVERYIRGWLHVYRQQTHSPSPTLMSLYGWLLDHIPDASGAPVLLHGDIGFHNMIVHEGRLTALVDWEFAHVGDPAEDVGFVRNTGGNMPWKLFMQCYREAGGPPIDAQRLHFFQVWGFVRNASASNLASGRFASGELSDLKLTYTGHYHFPLFIRAACDLIRAGVAEGA